MGQLIIIYKPGTEERIGDKKPDVYPKNMCEYPAAQGTSRKSDKPEYVERRRPQAAREL